MMTLHPYKRIEELAFQVEALRKDNAKLRVQVADETAKTNAVAEKLLAAEQERDQLKADNARLAATLNDKVRKIGRLIQDNGRLLTINANVCEWKGVAPARRRVDDEGNAIPKEGKQ